MRAITIISYLFLLCSSFFYAQDSDSIIFFDVFNENQNNWPLFNNDYSEMSFREGKLFMKSKVKDSGTYTYRPFNIDESGDFTIEVRIRQEYGNEGYTFGLMWGCRDLDNCFSYEVSDMGYALVRKAKDGNFSKPVDDIKSYYFWENNFNLLSVVKTGGKYHFLLNHHKIGEMPWEAFMGNNIGFIVYGDQSIEVDELVFKNSGASELNWKEQGFSEDDFADFKENFGYVISAADENFEGITSEFEEVYMGYDGLREIELDFPGAKYGYYGLDDGVYKVNIYYSTTTEESPNYADSDLSYEIRTLLTEALTQCQKESIGGEWEINKDSFLGFEMKHKSLPIQVNVNSFITNIVMTIALEK